MTCKLSRRTMLRRGALFPVQWGLALGGWRAARAQSSAAAVPTAADTFALRKQGRKIPVIFDTDIGGDIDDTWALVMLLKSPELDVRLAVADSTNAIYRARLLAKLLQTCGRTDIPVAVGVHQQDKPGPQSEWIGKYQLTDYPGTIHKDGVGALIDTINQSPEPITLVCIGPVPNIRAALQRDPGIARKARFVGMHGSVRRGYRGGARPSAEWNVRADPKALQRVLAAPWDITFTPLDTCGIVHLEGDRYQRVYRCSDPAVQALVANYRVWAKSKDPSGKRIDPARRSTTLFDTVAVYLAYAEELTKMETIPLRVTDDGFTVPDRQGKPVHCAMEWKDLDAFKDHLVQRLTGK